MFVGRIFRQQPHAERKDIDRWGKPIKSTRLPVQ
jgi:hypothetical protein